MQLKKEVKTEYAIQLMRSKKAKYSYFRKQFSGLFKKASLKVLLVKFFTIVEARLIT
jgi:hypothetical protein